MSVPTMDELVEAFGDTYRVYSNREILSRPHGSVESIRRDAFREALLAVLDRLKPVVAETYVQGVLGCPSEGYRPGTANDIEVDAKAYATRIIDQIKGA